MDIVKQLNRNVTFSRSGVIIQTLLEDVTAVLNNKRNGIIITDLRGRSVEVFTRQIENTQILPAAPIKFQPQGTVALWDILFDPTAGPIFNELHMTSGAIIPVDETNIKTIAAATYTVLNTDYILWFTANCTITLPVIIASRIAYPIRIFSRNVLLTVNPNAGATINGKTFFNMGKYDMQTFRPGSLTEWGVGD
jgi:hypothetical protein